MVKSIKLFGFIFAFVICVKAQNHPPKFTSIIDSLEYSLTMVKSDSSKMRLLNALAEECEINDIPKYTSQLIQLAEKNLARENNSSAIYKIYLKYLSDGQVNYGYYLKQKGNITEALDYYERSLVHKKSLNDLPGVALLLNNIGMIYDNQGSIQKALEFHLQSLKIQEQLANKPGIANSLNNIAGIYDNQGEHEKALEYFKKSLAIRKEINDERGIATSLANIAFIYLTQGDTVTAISYLNQTKAIHLKQNDKIGLGYDFNNLGFISLNQGKIDTAFYYYTASLKIREEIGDKSGMAFSHNNLATIYFKQKNYQEAIHHSNRSLIIAKQLGYPMLIRDAALSLKNSYTHLNKFKEALSMHELYYQMRDSINNLETKKSTIKSQFKYEFEKKEAILNEQQAQERLIAKEKNEKQKLIIWSTIVGLIFVLLFLVFAFYQLQKTKKQKLLIDKQKQTVDEKQKEILDSIHYAKRIQYALLASDSLLNQHLPKHFVLFKPKDVVSGDFYWAAPSSEGFIYITADCTGHGVPGAFMSLLNISKLSQAINESKIYRPDQILNDVRREIIKALNPKDSVSESKDGMDAVVCKLDVRQMKLEYAAANNSFYIVRKGAVLTCKADKMPVGKGHDDTQPFTYNEIALQKGDIIYTFTDGFADQFGGPKGKKFMYKQFSEVLLALSKEPMEVQKEKLSEQFDQWKGSLEQVDDVCVIAVKI